MTGNPWFWYGLAALFGAIGVLCGFRGREVGARRDADARIALETNIDARLAQIGNQLRSTNSNAAATPAEQANREEIRRDYDAQAREFFDSLTLKAAEQQSRDANQRVEEIRRTRVVREVFLTIEADSKQLAEAFNTRAGRKSVEVSSGGTFPENVFESVGSEPVHILYRFDGQPPNHWAVRLVRYGDQTPAIQFLRLVASDGSDDYGKMRLTNDSINLVLFAEEFGVSLNSQVSQAVAENVVGDLPRQRRPMAEVKDAVIALVRRTIEYQLLAQVRSR